LFYDGFMQFHITHLYPHHMELYGDMGNILAITWMLEKVGFEVLYQPVHPGDSLPETTHFYFIGGGQDLQQLQISDDLISKGDRIRGDVERGIPLLSICGGYQLLGEKFVTGEGKLIPGVGLFPVVTKALDTSIHSRSIGDIAISCLIPELKDVVLVGFENHSGQTYLVDNKKAGYLGKVLNGKGNNAEEGFEGCVYRHAIGTYMHGSCLPKNPELTQYLIRAATDSSFPDADHILDFNTVDISIALKARSERLRILL